MKIRKFFRNRQIWENLRRVRNIFRNRVGNLKQRGSASLPQRGWTTLAESNRTSTPAIRRYGQGWSRAWTGMDGVNTLNLHEVDASIQYFYHQNPGSINRTYVGLFLIIRAYSRYLANYRTCP